MIGNHSETWFDFKHPMTCKLVLSVVLVLTSLYLPPVHATEKSITIAYTDKISTLDPAIAYDWVNYLLVSALCDGLVRINIGSTTTDEPKLALAKSHTVSADGKTHDFKLHQGVRFHNDREVTAKDFKYSFERVVNPDTKSPGASFFQSIRGYDDFRSGKTTGLSGVKVMDPYWLRLETNEPDAAFMKKLSLNFFCVVAEEELQQATFDENPISAGSFRVTHWEKGDKLLLERFEKHYRKDQIKIDRLNILLEQNRLASLVKLERGEIDIMGNTLPSIHIIEARRKQQWYGRYIAENTSYGASNIMFVSMNTKMAPFDNVSVRRAANLAIDKKKLEKHLGFTVSITDQIPPPGLIGYQPGYQPYGYAPERARKLLKAAGFSEGVKTELHYLEKPEIRHICEFLQKQLARVGIHAKLYGWEMDKILEIAQDPKRGAMIISEGLGWILDYQDPSNIYLPLLSSDSAKPGSWNWSFYSNPKVDALAAEANTIIHDEKKRNAQWQQVFQMVMEDAPWIPLYNRKHYLLIGNNIRLIVENNDKATKEDGDNLILFHSIAPYENLDLQE